ncbi:MAG: Asp-tRNA(Asn)/Glu-tRNA(Gln) amidotransferase subunit GatA [Phycisphaerae bacterium]|nr:Asp-tRNA(Asn)/Glu-tRNA(Gln) amidotransferase subunit GatA [Phycisphaerae bacterium]
MSRGASSLVGIRDAVTARRASAEHLTAATLARATGLNDALNAFVEIHEEEAIRQARAADARAALGGKGTGASGRLAGVPLALKDNICVAWGRTTCASRMLEDYRSPYHATVVQRLLDAGAVIVGKTNLDQFGMGSSTEHSVFGPTRNPWDPTRTPGGSSGGSAAAVAARIVPAALGSDTGGSIRQPASHCGVVGLKPTYGRVSRYGLVAYASSLDQIGPLATNVRDCAEILSVIAGHDANDATSLRAPVEDFAAGIDAPIEGLTLGVPRQARSESNHPAVTGALAHAEEVFRAHGARVIEVDLPHAAHAIAAYYVIATAEASSNLARFDGVRYGRRAALGSGEGLGALYERSRAEGLGEEVKRRIMLGTFVLSSGYYDAYYLTAQRARRLIRNDYDRAFEQGCRALLMPASPGPAFTLGEKLADPMTMYLEDVYTVGVNLAGLPALTVPAGFAEIPAASGRGASRLPVGIQLIGPALSEGTLLRIGRQFERATAWHEQVPSLIAE